MEGGSSRLECGGRNVVEGGVEGEGRTEEDVEYRVVV